MEQIRDICAGCGGLYPIQNRTHWLCGECVFKRNHGGKSREEVYKERHDRRQEKKVKLKKMAETPKDDLIGSLKKVFSIKKISNKRASRHEERNKTYAKIDREREPVCEGCGKNLPVSHSHLLSEQDRPDLYANEENIRLHCFGNYNSCHDKWERGLIHEVVLMDDFKENLEFIKMVDAKRYNAIIAKAEFEGIKI